MYAIPLTGHALHKVEMEYHGDFGHNIGRIKHIARMSRIGICYLSSINPNYGTYPTWFLIYQALCSISG